MQEFIKKQGGVNPRASKKELKAAWLTSSQKVGGGGKSNVFQGLTEEDFKTFTKAELRKNKEQYLTDIMCAIPDTLDIDMDCQKIIPFGKRFGKCFSEDLCKNWLRDPFTLLAFLVFIGNLIFYCVVIFLPVATV